MPNRVLGAFSWVVLGWSGTPRHGGTSQLPTHRPRISITSGTTTVVLISVLLVDMSSNFATLVSVHKGTRNNQDKMDHNN